MADIGHHGNHFKMEDWPTIGMIGPKIKALALTVEILWPYIYFLVMADIGHYGNHSEMEDWPNNRYDRS